MVWYYVVIRGNRAEKKNTLSLAARFMISQMDLRILYIFFFDLYFNYYFSLIFSAIIFRLNLIFFFY